MENSLSFSYHIHEEIPINVEYVGDKDCTPHIRIKIGNNGIFINDFELAKDFRTALCIQLSEAIQKYESDTFEARAEEFYRERYGGAVPK